nr:MAG TPA: hypothetical protein [Caudoviricetes sp.]
MTVTFLFLLIFPIVTVTFLTIMYCLPYIGLKCTYFS